VSGFSMPLGLRVVVLARDPETRDTYTDYLRALGAIAHARSDRTPGPDTDALVVFADDFDPGSAERFACEWAGLGRKRCRLVLVTSRPALAQRVRRDPRASMHERPFWGWLPRAAITRGKEPAEPVGEWR